MSAGPPRGPWRSVGAPLVAIAALLVLMVPIGLPEAGNAVGIGIFVMGILAIAMNLWLLWRGLRGRSR